MEVGVSNDYAQAVPQYAPSPRQTLVPQEHKTNPPAANNLNLHLSAATLHKALRIFNREMHGSINRALASAGLRPLSSANSLTPQNLVNKTLNHLNQVAPQADTQKSVRDKIADGLQETKNFLSRNGLLPDTLGSDIDAAAAQVQDNESNRTQASVFYRSTEINRNAHLEIRTRDGDIVQIDISDSRSRSNLRMATSTDSQQMSARSVEKNASQSLQISVTGDLDDEELQAINGLVQQVGKLADQFFDGDMNKALDRQNMLDFSSDEIAGFQLALSEQRTQTTVAIRQTGGTPQDVSALMQQLADFAKQFADMTQSDAASLLAQPAQQLGQILQSALLVHPESTLDPAQAKNIANTAVQAAPTDGEAVSADADTPADTEATSAPAASSEGDGSESSAEPDQAAATAPVSNYTLRAVRQFVEIRSMFELTQQHDSAAQPAAIDA